MSLNSVERPYRFSAEQSIEFAQFRAEEIAVIIQELVSANLIKEENLRGDVADLGTGSGSGVLAIRKYVPRSIVGVDVVEFPFGYDTRVVIGDAFVLMDAEDFLSGENPKFSLITVFNFGRLARLEREAMSRLVPGGQFLVTSDHLLLPRVGRHMSVNRWMLSEDSNGWHELLDDTNHDDQFFYLKTKK